MFGFDKKKIDKKEVGAKIRKIRLEKDLTLDEFSKRIDAQLNSVYLWEKGKFLPRKAMILKICEIGEITPVELLKKIKRNRQKGRENDRRFFRIAC